MQQPTTQAATRLTTFLPKHLLRGTHSQAANCTAGPDRVCLNSLDTRSLVELSACWAWLEPYQITKDRGLRKHHSRVSNGNTLAIWP